MNDWVEQEAWRQAHRDEIAKALQPMWLLWLASLSEPVVLAVIVFGFGARLREGFTMDEALPLTLMRTVLIVIAALALAASVLLRRLLLHPPSGDRTSSAAESSNSLSGSALYRSRIIVPTAMAAAPSIFGFVLFWLGDSLMVFAGFAVAALLGILWHYPRQDELIAFCMRCENGDSGLCGRK
jgi:hypothetical protein